MLRSLKDLERYTVRATDGDVGAVESFLLDDERWTVRYLVVKAGGPFSGRQVLVSPISFRQADWSTQRFHLGLTLGEVENSPSVDTDLPVSLQRERDDSRMYPHPCYWSASGIWGKGAHPDPLAADGWSDQPEPSDEQPRGAHLRSTQEVAGYHIHGSDGLIGHVTDFLVDDETWEIRYLVVDTSRWWAGGQEVLVSPSWATSVSWEKGEIHVDLTRQAIKEGPRYDAVGTLDRDFEARLHRHHGRSAYWDGGASRQGAPRDPRLTNLTRRE